MTYMTMIDFEYWIVDFFIVYWLCSIYLLVCQFQGGSIAKGSELQIEVAEFLWKNVEVMYL